MRKNRLNERDLSRIVRRVINEGVIPTFSPEEFAQQYPNYQGTAKVEGGDLVLMMKDGRKVIVTNSAV